MANNDIEQVIRQLCENDCFILVGHAIPDGDCIGSLVGLYLALTSAGKKCSMLLEDPVPPIYRFLGGSEQVQTPDNFTGSGMVVYLDCSDADRAGKEVLACLPSGTGSINIDHHQSNRFFADYNLVKAESAATAEIVYHLLVRINIAINSDIAGALYAGIVMDTGSFRYSNTSADTMKTAAALLERGVDLEATRINLFESRPRQEIMLLRLALQSLAISDDGRIAWMQLSYQEVEALGLLEVHPEDVINYTRMIAGVEVGLLFREISPGVVKIGFRSKHEIDVAAIAAQFGGGGHKQAAGAKQNGTLAEIKARVIASVRDVME